MHLRTQPEQIQLETLTKLVDTEKQALVEETAKLIQADYAICQKSTALEDLKLQLNLLVKSDVFKNEKTEDQIYQVVKDENARACTLVKD